MQPEPGKRPGAFTRWIVLPLAFAWLGLVITAPLVLFSEAAVGAGFVVGALVGLAVAIRNPKWLSAPPSDRDRPRRVRRVTDAQRAVLTTISVVFTAIVVYSSLQPGSGKGTFYLLAMLLLISFARRSLRRAWGVPGSMIGMLVSGCLLVLVVRSVAEGAKLEGPEIMLLVMLVAFEALDEMRGLQRMNRRPPT